MYTEETKAVRDYDLGPQKGPEPLDYARVARIEREKAAQAAQCAGSAPECDYRPPTVLRELHLRRCELEAKRAAINQRLDIVNAMLSVFEG